MRPITPLSRNEDRPPVLDADVAQASGKLDKFLEKRRKKNAAKDHRYLPSSRRQAGGED